MAKTVNFELIDPTVSQEPYDLLIAAREQWHYDLNGARIALAWQKNIRPDVDGRLTLGKCVKVTDLYREFAEWDFIIVLNRQVWQMAEFTREKKLALLDHELSHAAPAEDADGEQIFDDRGRAVWRTRKHEIEEFVGVVARHGCYKRDLTQFAEALIARQKGESLFGELNQEVTDTTSVFSTSNEGRKEAVDGITSCQVTVMNADGTPGPSVSFDDPIRTMRRATEALKAGAPLPTVEDGVVKATFTRKHIGAEITVREQTDGWYSDWRVRTRTTSNGGFGGHCLSESLAREAAAKAIFAHVHSMNGSVPEKAKANVAELKEWCAQWISDRAAFVAGLVEQGEEARA